VLSLIDSCRVKIAALIASRNRENLLCKRSIFSISQQSLQPDLIIIVNDGQPFSVKSTKTLEKLCQMSDLKILENKSMIFKEGHTLIIPDYGFFKQIFGKTF